MNKQLIKDKIKRARNIFIFLVLLFAIAIMYSGMASAYEPHKQNTGLEYSFTSNNATQCNVTTGNTPDGLSRINQIATKNDNTFNITILSGNFSTLGIYCYNLVCTDASNIETGSFCREVTVTGKELTSAKSTSYVIILIISILIFVGLLIFGLSLPSSNKKDEMTGYILAINNLKYLKYVILGFAYLSLVWISYYVWMLVYAYLDFEFLATLFRFMFIFLVSLILPMFILFTYLTITNLIHDSKVGDYLLRGLKIR